MSRGDFLATDARVEATRKSVSKDFVEKLKQTVSILEVVGEHVVLRKQGANHTGLCPFHQERSPSFSVNETKNVYHCYGCKEGGGILDFVMKMHGLSFREAVEELAERAKLALPTDWRRSGGGEGPQAEQARQAAEKKQVAYRLNRFVATYYRHQYESTPSARQYVRSRGITEELEREYYVGFAPSGWEGLAAHMVAKKAPVPLANELGLVRPSKKPGGAGHFDLFRNRVVFPIIDLRGRVVAFGGRALPPPYSATEDSPKYLNSPESMLFQKSRVVFGLYQAQKHIREQDATILVEGYFDVLGLAAAGIRNAVATCGTAFTHDHLSMIRRLGDKVIVLFDSDRAGIEATERAMETGLQDGVILYGATLPEGIDPDEMAFDSATGKPKANGAEALRKLLSEAQPILDRQMEAIFAECIKGGPEVRSQALKRIGRWLGMFRDPVGRELRAQTTADRLGVSRALVNQAIQSSGTRVGGEAGVQLTQQPSPVRPPAGPPGRARPMPQAPLSRVERTLLAAFAAGGEFEKLFAEAGRLLPPGLTISDAFDYIPAREWVALVSREPEVLAQMRKSPDVFLDPRLDRQVRSILTETWVGAGSEKSSLSVDEVRPALGRRLEVLWARISQRLRSELKAGEAKEDTELQSDRLKEYLDLRRKIKEFSHFYDKV